MARPVGSKNRKLTVGAPCIKCDSVMRDSGGDCAACRSRRAMAKYYAKKAAAKNSVLLSMLSKAW